MNWKTRWAPLAAAMSLAAAPALAAPQAVGYTAADGVNTVAVSAATGLPINCLSGCGSPTVPGNLATNQVGSVGTSATLIVSARAGRSFVTVVNQSTSDVYLGSTSGVTISTGLLLPGAKGASLTLPYTGSLFGVVSSGTAAVSFGETY